MGIRLTKADCKALGLKAPSKYKAIPTTVDGHRFSSKKEARRYGELKLLEQAGHIFELELQPRFPLLVNGEKIGDYVADFQYKKPEYESAGPDSKWNLSLVVEDVKSQATKTPIYKWKKKHLRCQYGIEILET